jgi:hypothetical protein
MAYIVVNELISIRSLQNKMKALADDAASCEDFKKIKQNVSRMQSMNRQIQSKVSIVQSKTMGIVSNVRSQNASTLKNAHRSISSLFGKLACANDLEKSRSITKKLARKIASISTRTDKMLTEEKNFGSKMRNRI